MNKEVLKLNSYDKQKEQLLNQKDKQINLQLTSIFTLGNANNLSLDELLSLIKSLVWNFSKLSFFKIKEIEKEILNDEFSFEKKQLLILSIVVYYLNNNFLDDIIELLYNLFPEKETKDLKELLKIFIEKIDIDIYKGHDIYYLIYARLYVIKDYLFGLELDGKISKDENSLQNIQKDVVNFIDYWLDKIDFIIKDDGINEIKLTTLLTIFSHINYYLAFIDDSNEINEKINILANNILFIYNKKEILFSTVSDFHKQVLYAIISFILVVSERIKCLNTDTVNQLEKIKKNLLSKFDDNVSFEMRAFMEDYCGIGENNVNYANLVGNTKENKFILAVTLENISYSHNLIGKRASILGKYLERLYKLEKDNKFLTRYSDNVYLKVSTIEKQIFDFNNIDGVVKDFLIRVLKIPLNVNNMHIYLKFFNSNFENLDIDFLDLDASNSQNILLSKYKKKTLVSKKWQIDFYFPKEYDALTDMYYNNRAIIDGFMDKIYEKLSKTDQFIGDIMERINLLKEKHIETLNHMVRVGNLFKEIIESGNFKEEECVLKKLSNFLHIKKDKLYTILGYLHDIGKSDNNLNLQYYNNVNIRSYVLNVLEIFLNNLKLDIDRRYQEIKLSIYGKLVNTYMGNLENTNVSNNEIIKKIRKEVNNMKKYNLYKSIPAIDVDSVEENNTKTNTENIINIIKQYSKDTYINKQVVDFYNKYRLREFLQLSYSVDLTVSLHSIIYAIYTRLKELGVQHIDILEPNFKEKFNDYFQYLLNKTKILTVGEKLDIDLYMLALLIFLDKISYYHSKELKEPHIVGGERFFSKYPDFTVLSWVLIHHIDYPNIQELEENKILNGLKKWKELIGLKDFYFSPEEIKTKDKKNIVLNPAKRDTFMVLLTAVDIIDAILSKRNYQGIVSYELSDIFIKEDIIDQLYYYYSDTMPSDMSERFDKIMGWLEKDFKDNVYWSKIRETLLDNKKTILDFYEHKGKN